MDIFELIEYRKNVKKSQLTCGANLYIDNILKNLKIKTFDNSSIYYNNGKIYAELIDIHNKLYLYVDHKIFIVLEKDYKFSHDSTINFILNKFESFLNLKILLRYQLDWGYLEHSLNFYD